jgi:hypothetical protein
MSPEGLLRWGVLRGIGVGGRGLGLGDTLTHVPEGGLLRWGCCAALAWAGVDWVWGTR